MKIHSKTLPLETLNGSRIKVTLELVGEHISTQLHKIKQEICIDFVSCELLLSKAPKNSLWTMLDFFSFIK